MPMEGDDAEIPHGSNLLSGTLLRKKPLEDFGLVPSARNLRCPSRLRFWADDELCDK